MDPEQCEFLAGDEMIDVIPNFNEPMLHMVAGDVGPFEAGLSVSVPMWMAINLRKRHKCTIVPPVWLEEEALRDLLDKEKEDAALTQLPSKHFFEIAHLLVREAKEDILKSDQLKSLIQDLWDKREAKLRTSTLKFLKQTAHSHARMDNVLQLEIAGLREPLLAATREIDRLTMAKHNVQQAL